MRRGICNVCGQSVAIRANGKPVKHGHQISNHGEVARSGCCPGTQELAANVPAWVTVEA